MMSAMGGAPIRSDCLLTVMSSASQLKVPNKMYDLIGFYLYNCTRCSIDLINISARVAEPSGSVVLSFSWEKREGEKTSRNEESALNVYSHGSGFCILMLLPINMRLLHGERPPFQKRSVERGQEKKEREGRDKVQK